MSSYLIETNGLTKKFGKFTAVDGIDLKVPEGVIYGFLGPNGAGKSTTIRMLLGLIKPTEGKVKVFNKSFSSSRIEILGKVGSMVEYPSYYGHLTAWENLNIARKILELDKNEIDRVLKIVRLDDVKNKTVKKFSLGMKQRLGIAQALLGKPELLILDEPTNGLDPAGIHEIRDLIKGLPEKMGITLLVSSHILSEIELVASHVGIINKGKLLFQGTLEELRGKSVSKIRIDVVPTDRAAEFLKRKGYAPEIKDKSIFIGSSNIKPCSINKELILEGFEVNHLSYNQSNLEDIFLEITSEGEGA